MPSDQSTPAQATGASLPRGAKRSTKVAGKLKVLPEQPEVPAIVSVEDISIHGPPRNEGLGVTGSDDSDMVDDVEEVDEPEDVEVSRETNASFAVTIGFCVKIYNQISLIPDGTAKRDALRLTRKKAKSLPRVTVYATAR
jgi:hypothetical protein